MCEPCTGCGAEVHIPEGLEPTELCNTCAQARVIELEAMVVELRRDKMTALGGALEERNRELGRLLADARVEIKGLRGIINAMTHRDWKRMLERPDAGPVAGPFDPPYPEEWKEPENERG